MLLWNNFVSAKLGRCKFKRRVTWNNKACHTSETAAAGGGGGGTQANKQTDRQDKHKKVEEKGEPAWEHANNNSSGELVTAY